MNNFPLTRGASLRVLIAGSAAMTNDSLAQLIAEPDEVVVDTASKTRHALMLASWEKPDVILIDLDLGDNMLSQTITQLRAISPPPMVIVLALGIHPVLRNRCLSLGASHVFDKTAELDGLIDVLRALRDRKNKVRRGLDASCAEEVVLDQLFRTAESS